MHVVNTALTPVILSGGSGTRLWPLSRSERPKQFVAITTDETMLALTIGRTAGFAECVPPIIIAGSAHASLIDDQVGNDATVILEPYARNTAPAIALAALVTEEDDCAMLVMPSDHLIGDIEAFRDAVHRALPLVEQGWLVTLGIAPDAPETGYGYIALGNELAPGVQKVDRFVEKPDARSAAAMIAAGNHVWNGGIFLFRARAYLEALERFEPDILASVRASLSGQNLRNPRILPDPAQFAASPSISIDYAVMERADKVACVPVDMGWSDVGSWDALHAIADKDGDDNVRQGAATLIDTRNCLVRSDGPHVTLVGVDDLIVVASGNDVLIVPRGRSQLVKHAADAAAERQT